MFAPFFLSQHDVHASVCSALRTDRYIYMYTQYVYTFLQFSKIFLSLFIMYMYMLVITHISVPFKAVWRQFASLHVFF